MTFLIRRKSGKILAIAALCLSLVACGGRDFKPSYQWSQYPGQYYFYLEDEGEKTVEERATELLKVTQKLIEAGEKEQKVPPGLYAEHAFLLMQTHQYEDSQSFYEKEVKAWPESRYFIEKMIAELQKKRGL